MSKQDESENTNWWNIGIGALSGVGVGIALAPVAVPAVAGVLGVGGAIWATTAITVVVISLTSGVGAYFANEADKQTKNDSKQAVEAAVATAAISAAEAKTAAGNAASSATRAEGAAGAAAGAAERAEGAAGAAAERAEGAAERAEGAARAARHAEGAIRQNEPNTPELNKQINDILFKDGVAGADEDTKLQQIQQILQNNHTQAFDARFKNLYLGALEDQSGVDNAQKLRGLKMIVACHDFKNIAGFNKALQKDFIGEGRDEFDYLKSLGKKIAEHAKANCFDEGDGRITTFLLPSKSLLDLIRESQIDVERFNSPEFKNISDVVTAAAAAAAALGGGAVDGGGAAPAGGGAAARPVLSGAPVADGGGDDAAAADPAAAAREAKIRKDFLITPVKDHLLSTTYQYKLLMGLNILSDDSKNNDQKIDLLKNLMSIQSHGGTGQEKIENLISDFTNVAAKAPEGAIATDTPWPTALRVFAQKILSDVSSPDITNQYRILALEVYLNELKSGDSDVSSIQQIRQSDNILINRSTMTSAGDFLKKISKASTRPDGKKDISSIKAFDADAAAVAAAAVADAGAGGGAAPATVLVHAVVAGAPAAVAADVGSGGRTGIGS